MRWQNLRRSTNVEDRRGGGGRLMIGGGVGSLVLMLLYMFLGGDPTALLDSGGAERPTGPAAEIPADDEGAQFVSAVLANTEDVWKGLFPRFRGGAYRDPRLVLFAGQIDSACGFAGAAVGPFYCGRDERVYIDLSFYRELSRRFGAPGDFAQAYVIAHEVGHHVQNLLGISERVLSARGRLSEAEFNKLSVQLELHADYLAGVWAHHARNRNLLEVGDVEEALRAAAAIGDDTLQKRGRGYVVPESFTHGTSAQRVHWFRKGLESGDPAGGDSLNAAGK